MNDKIKTIVLVGIVALFIHSAVQYIPYKINVNEFEHEAVIALRQVAIGMNDQEEFMTKVRGLADDLGFSIPHDNMKVSLTGNTLRFRAEYDVTLDMLWGDTVRHISVDIEAVQF